MNIFDAVNGRFIGVCLVIFSLGSLTSLTANAESCPCDVTSIPDSAWSIDTSAHSFDKTSIDTGLLCEDVGFKDASDPAHFTVFKRFVGIKDGQKSGSLIEIRVSKYTEGTKCLIQVENNGVFDATKNVQHEENRFSQEDFLACINDAKAYAERLKMTCVKKNTY